MQPPVTGSPAPYRLVRTTCTWCGHTSCVCPPARVEPCACGGELRARDLSEWFAAVSAHQRTPEHAAWREARGL